MEQAVAQEIERLHRFFEAWLTGTVPPWDEELAPFQDAVDDRFVFVGTDGCVRDKAAVVAWLQEIHSRDKDSTPPFRIWIENVRLHDADDQIVLATYDEWQEREGVSRGRISTVLFHRDEDAPLGLRWRHLHETWLPGSAPT